jgi:hypothetical protein
MENPEKIYGTITSVFVNKADVDLIYGELLENGFQSKDISVVYSEEGVKKHYKDIQEVGNLRSRSRADSRDGAIFGTGLGAILGLVASLTTNLIYPELSTMFSGPVVGAISGDITGVVMGAIIGAIIGSRYPKEKSEFYKKYLNGYGVLVSVGYEGKEQAEWLTLLFQRNNGQAIFNEGPYKQKPVIWSDFNK